MWPRISRRTCSQTLALDEVGSAHEFERIRKDGRVIQMRGNPISGGGFVTTFADITPFRTNEAILEARVKTELNNLPVL